MSRSSWRESARASICKLVTRVLRVNQEDPACGGACAHLKKIGELQEAVESLRAQVQIDDLTGVLNRRAVLEAADGEVKRCMRRDGCVFSVLLIDVDKFKRFNTIGWFAGDSVLKKVAAVIKRVVRQGVDAAGRLGGDEFFIVCPETTSDQAEVLAERIRKEVEVTFVEFDGDVLRTTVSIGVTSYVSGDQDHRPILKRADVGLRKTKESGRNGIEVV